MGKTLQKINIPLFKERKLEALVFRDDLPDAVMCGNKLRKLKYNLEKAKRDNYETLLTFGGMFSNHIAATAAAGRKNGFKTIGIIRGEGKSKGNITISRAADHGMLLHFVDREFYRMKDTAEMRNYLEEKFGQFYLIPEGGSNKEGFKGCSEIVNEISMDFDYILCPCGTGTTLAGLAASLLSHQTAIGVSVLKNNFTMEETVKKFLGSEKKETHWQIIHDYHFGGYAKSNEILDSFVKKFGGQTGIPCEPVYTGKMFYALVDLAEKKFFKQGSKVVAVHTGGMQYLYP